MSVTNGQAGPTYRPHYQPQQIGVSPFAQQQHPQPSTPTGVSRAIAIAKGLSGKAVVLAGLIFVLQATMDKGHRPSDLIGSFHGNTESAELNAKRTAQVETTSQMANAQAAAPANWQMEQQLSATQQQVIAGSLETQSTMANLADAACIGGAAIGAFFGQNPDAAQIAHGLQAGCGAGDAIRHNMVNTLAGAAREGSGVVQRSSPIQNAGAPTLHYVPPSGSPYGAAYQQR